VFETTEDRSALRALLNRSYDRAGSHLASIHTDKVRLSADELIDRLTGMRVLVLATVSSDGRPLAGPVDAFFVRGHWHLSTSPSALRTRHMDRRPDVSGAYVEGEALVVIVHGTAERLDVAELDPAYRQALVDHYGDGWVEGWGDEIAAYRIAADRMFAADMSRHLTG
jgi:hypothetical protein